LGRYVIEAVLGRGMMGVVYRAMDPVLDRKVALKVVAPAFSVSAEEQLLMEERFLREARLAARVTHPNVVAVHDVGWDAGTRRPYMALEYLEGRTLARVMESGPAMGWGEAVRLVSRLADALHHTHGYGIVHRDIKPANIMILPSGEPKIMDFGIAKASAAELTAAGECWGTPLYMSPEQACGKPMDGRTDIFSLGSVLYQLLTGRRAFEGENVPQIMTRVVNDEPPLPSLIEPALPHDLDVVITRALAKDPELRYSSGHAFAEDLQDVLNSRPLRERDGLKTLSMLKPVASGLPADVVAAPTLRGAHVRARPGGRATRPLLAVGVGLVIGIALLGFRYSTGAKAPALSDAPVTAAKLDLPATPGPATRPTRAPSAITPARSVAPIARSRHSPVMPGTIALATTRAATADATLAPAPTARLSLSVQHSVKKGRLRLWIDGRLALETELVSTAGRKLLVFKKQEGRLAKIFDVAPGDRLVRVEVEEDGQRRSAGLSGTFESHGTRLLEVKVGGNVDLKWKS
jgi:eukaryotic-like serine/threonine-protein kinase